jgi:NAD(P)-dependent dehydrogenase (short-subunit alcohol dehydrogenase family)
VLWIYGATKAAIRSLARTRATCLKERGVGVNVVSPDMIITPAMETYPNDNPGAGEGLTQPAPLRQSGEPDDIVAAVRFLASRESRKLAGEELVVDGGCKAV